MRAPTEIVYAERRRPPCVVWGDGRWYAGELRSWHLREDGWWALVSYYVDPDTAYMRHVPGTDVRRLDTSDAEWHDPRSPDDLAL